MSSYFDDKVSQVRATVESAQGDFRQIWASVADIERKTIKEVCLVTGDREFPDDLREKIMGIIATQAMCEVHGIPPTKKALDFLRATNTSYLLESLHSVFHEVARRRIETRFGLLSDSPKHILVLREEWEGERIVELRTEGSQA